MSGPLRCRDASQDQQRTAVQPNLDYKVDVMDMRIVRAIVSVGGTTRHDTGGKETTRQLGAWVRQRCLGREGFGVVYLERNLPQSGKAARGWRCRSV